MHGCMERGLHAAAGCSMGTASHAFRPDDSSPSIRHWRKMILFLRAHTYSAKEALINSLFAFILEFLCNARNEATRIASYLRSLMTQQCIKILIKANSMNESVLP